MTKYYVKVIVLSSGSKGNTTYIESNEAKILIDAGNTAKYITESLENINVNVKDIDAIFITHTHTDHIGGLKTFVKKGNLTVFIKPGLLDELGFLDNYKTNYHSNLKYDEELTVAGRLLFSSF